MDILWDLAKLSAFVMTLYMVMIGVVEFRATVSCICRYLLLAAIYLTALFYCITCYYNLSLCIFILSWLTSKVLKRMNCNVLYNR